MWTTNSVAMCRIVTGTVHSSSCVSWRNGKCNADVKWSRGYAYRVLYDEFKAYAIPQDEVIYAD